MDTTTTTHPSHWRIGDAERTHVCDLLATHHAQGRLRAGELDERLGRAVAAVTGADLDAVLADLPPIPPTPARVAPAEPRRSSQAVDVLLGLTAMPAGIIVLLMILGAMAFAPWLVTFTVIGGTLTAYVTMVATRSAYRSSAGGPTPGSAPAADAPAR